MRSKSLQIVAVLLLTLFFSMLSSIQLVVAQAASGTLVEVKPHASFAPVGETFSVNITVVNVQNLYGIEATLYWNASILDLVKVNVRLGESDGVLYKPLFPVQNETSQQQSKYILAETSTPPAPSFNGTGNIVRLTFNVTRIGSCELSLGVKLASNIMTPAGVAPISHATIDGFFGPIQINAFPVSITVGESLNISGFIAPAQANVTVTILFKPEDETAWHILENVTTDRQGSYLCIWKPQSTGKYNIESFAIILGLKETSPTVSITVNESGQFVWLYPIVLAAIIVIAVATLLLYRKEHKKTKRH